MRAALLATETPAQLAAAIAAARDKLRAGEVVALPTETVYGLAADALRPEAAARIFEAKERPFFDPLICHLPEESWLERVAAIPESSRALVDAAAQRFLAGTAHAGAPAAADHPRSGDRRAGNRSGADERASGFPRGGRAPSMARSPRRARIASAAFRRRPRSTSWPS